MITDPHKFTGAVKKLGKEVGFDLVGITSAEPLVQAGQRLCQAIQSGHTAGMGYLERNPSQRANPKGRFPWARGIICVGLNYNFVPPDPTPSPNPGAAKLISRYALGRDYHLVLSEKLRLFKDKLAQIVGRDFRSRLAVDTFALMEKPLAQRAGLGWLGKNSLIINPQFGSWIFLAELLTELSLSPDEPMENQCDNCTACIDACPTGALSEPGILDARKCLSYLTVEHKGDIPAAIIELVTKEDVCIFGCDICQEVCPFNRDRPQTKEPQFRGRAEIINLSLKELRSLTKPQFKKLFAQTPLARLSYHKLQQNLHLQDA